MVNFWDMAKDIRPSGESRNSCSAGPGQQTHRTWQWQPRLGSQHLPRLPVFRSHQFLGPKHWLKDKVLSFLSPSCRLLEGYAQKPARDMDGAYSLRKDS